MIEFSKLRNRVYWPPIFLMALAVLLFVIDTDGFGKILQSAHGKVLDNCGWLYTGTTFLMLISSVLLFLHPIARVRVGGEDAKPILPAWAWFSITICTTLATGIIFWGAAEPLAHFKNMPDFDWLPAPTDQDRTKFALAALYLDWSFHAYGIYAIPSVLFAYLFFNRRLPVSISTAFVPLFGEARLAQLADRIDMICIFVLSIGVSSSVGTGLIMVAGFLDHMFGVGQGPIVLGLVALVVVLSFVASAASGITRGIKWLSMFNFAILLMLFAFMLIFGIGVKAALVSWLDSFGFLLRHNLDMSVPESFFRPHPWSRDWPIFYWSSWIAWAPVTSVFLARLAYGRRIWQVLLVVFVLPSLFTSIWLGVYGSNALSLDMIHNGVLSEISAKLGPQSVIYKVFDYLPWSQVMQWVVFGTAFLSLVTAADSNTEVMSQIVARSGEKSSRTEVLVKLIWGLVVGSLAWVMVAFLGVDGLRVLNNIAGFPSVFIIICATACLWKICLDDTRRRWAGFGVRAIRGAGVPT